jgi:SAM-dependent methyltransferase
MSVDPTPPAGDGGLPPDAAGRLYDRIGRPQNTQTPFERPARERLITAGRFDTVKSLFELGCGTGILAQQLLTRHLAPDSTYVGVDVSSRMVELSRRRLAPFGDRARVEHIGGTLPLLAPGSSADRFVAAYVFNLLTQNYATSVLAGGLACLTSLTTGPSTISQLVTRTWYQVWRMAPSLVGGCRPINLRRLLNPHTWDVVIDTVIESWGVPAQLIIAAAT